MAGSLEDAFGPAALRFLRPMRVVGCGGGSYLGFSFCEGKQSAPSNRSGILLVSDRGNELGSPSCLSRLFHPLQAAGHQGSMHFDPVVMISKGFRDGESVSLP